MAAAATLRAQSAPRAKLILGGTRLVVAVDHKASLAHLPLTLCEQLGYFEIEGLDVEIRQFPDAAASMQALQNRSAHVLCGAFTQLLAPAAQGLALQSFVLQTRVPQLVLGVSRKSLPPASGMAALRGRRIGIQDAGGLSEQLARRVLVRAGVSPQDVEWVEQANSAAAVQAFRNGQLDALSYSDPAITLLEQLGELSVVADARTLRGTAEVFGGLLPSTCLIAPVEFLTRFPRWTQALADASVHALKWLQTAGPSDLIKTVPESHFQGDRSLFLQTFERSREAWSPDGVMPPQGPAVAQGALGNAKGEAANLRARAPGLSTNEFALKAKARWRA